MQLEPSPDGRRLQSPSIEEASHARIRVRGRTSKPLPLTSVRQDGTPDIIHSRLGARPTKPWSRARPVLKNPARAAHLLDYDDDGPSYPIRVDGASLQC